MYYIFNTNGKCVASCNYETNTEDLASRNEITVESETVYQLSEIQLVNGVITVITATFEEVKSSKLADIKSKLAATDYKCLKYVDGKLTETEYAPIKTERANLRTAYKAIEAATTIDELEGM